MMNSKATKYEEAIVSSAKAELASLGRIVTHQPLLIDPPSGQRWDVDLMLQPFEGVHADIPHIVEVKYGEGKTLPSSTVVYIVDRFRRLHEANQKLGVRCALLTNVSVSLRLAGDPLPPYMVVFDNVKSGKESSLVLRKWLTK